jgi:hypothetical protein
MSVSLLWTGISLYRIEGTRRIFVGKIRKHRVTKGRDINLLLVHPGVGPRAPFAPWDEWRVYDHLTWTCTKTDEQIARRTVELYA